MIGARAAIVGEAQFEGKETMLSAEGNHLRGSVQSLQVEGTDGCAEVPLRNGGIIHTPGKNSSGHQEEEHRVDVGLSSYSCILLCLIQSLVRCAPPLGTWWNHEDGSMPGRWRCRLVLGFVVSFDVWLGIILKYVSSVVAGCK